MGQYDEGCISGMVPCCQEGTNCYGVATHGAEIPFVFNTTRNACRSESICSEFVDPFTGHEPALVRSMQNYWSSFLATGIPVDTSGAGPTWPQADKGIAELVVPTVTIGPDTLTQKCELEQVLPRADSFSSVCGVIRRKCAAGSAAS